MLLALPAASQETTNRQSDPDRPTIALVLSGGAAKGMAHVGAIQVFEEEGIPIDIVAGTSAGAMIGSFYAVGYNGKQIEEIIRNAGDDLNDLFFDRIDARLLRIEETRIPRQTLVTLPMRGGKPTLPEGIVAGQRVQQLLSRYMWGFHQVEDFSQLPRPFICNAVDLVSGKDIALTEGFLPEAARACISLPGFFKPLAKDSLLIIDGGVSRNLPVLEAQSIGGEVLVGVDVSGDLDAEGDVQLGPEGHGNSMLFNLTKNLTIGRRSIVLDLRREIDLIVDPVTGGVSAYDFNNAWLYIQRGREAARAMVPEIRAFLDSLGHPQPLKDIQAPSLEPVMVGTLEIEGVDGPALELVERMIRFTLPQRIGPEDMDRLLTSIYSTDLFETVLYKMLPDPTGGPATIRMTIEPRELVNSVGVGLHYDDTYSASVLATIALRNKLRYGSSTALVLRLGKQTRASLEYFTRLALNAPITASAGIDFSSAPLRYGSVRTGQIPEQEQLRPIVRQNQLAARIGLGYAVNNHTLLGVRGQAGRYIERVKEYPITDSELWFVDGQFRAANYLGSKIEGRFYSTLAFLESKIFNRKAFPSRGYRLTLSAEIGRGLRDDDNLINRLEDLFGRELPRSEINDKFFPFRHYTAIGEWMIEPIDHLSIQVDAGYSRGAGDGLPLSYFTGVGGIHTSTVFEGQFFELPGTTTQKRLGTNGWKTSAGLQWEFSSEKFLTIQAHAGDAYFDLDLTEEEAAQQPEFAKNDGFDLDRATVAGSIQLGLVSPLGPIRLTAAKAEDNPVRLGIEIGHSF